MQASENEWNPTSSQVDLEIEKDKQRIKRYNKLTPRLSRGTRESHWL